MLGDGKLSGKIRKFENHLSVTKINENMNKSFGFSFCQLQGVSLQRKYIKVSVS